ncbi:MAG TPA: helix-turn-helix domain-containing protein [Oligoflexia bacterium]|nr:helix-turn-helix domain-containing protein [Oligoflexia bacterium]HMP49897.1 helix-turn-helix domain-containing protein [Oligoflexia bacterium]
MKRQKHILSEKDVLTSGEAAKICQVSLNTIIRCFDKGMIKGFRIPGSRFRRIPVNSLLRFIKEHNLTPNPELLNNIAIRKVSLFTDDDSLFRDFSESLGNQFRVFRVSSLFDAGINHSEGHILVFDCRTADMKMLLKILHSIQTGTNGDSFSRVVLLAWRENQITGIFSQFPLKILNCPAELERDKLLERIISE